MKLGNVGKGLMLFIHTENPLEILVVLGSTERYAAIKASQFSPPRRKAYAFR